MSRVERDPAIAPGSTSEALSDIDSDDSCQELTRTEASSNETSLRNGKDQMMSIVLMAVLLVTVVTVFSLSLAQFLVINDSQSLAQEVISALMVVGVIVILLLYVKNDVVAEIRMKPVRRSVRDQLKYILRHFLSIVGMSFFYPFSCILDLFHVVTAASCDSVWKQCGGQGYEHHIAVVLFHLLRILFMGAELLFCLRFHSARFMRNASVRCGLMIIVAVNLGLWFITLLKETTDRDAEPSGGFAPNASRIDLPTECRNVTDLKHALNCLDQATPEYRRLEHVKPYLFPFAIEFSILVGEFLAEKFFRCRKQTAEPSSKRQAPENSQSVMVCADTSSEVSAESARRSRPFRWTFVLVVAIGIFANVVCITLAFYTTPFGDSKSETSVVKGRGVFQDYLIFYWVLTSVLICVGFGCGGSTRVQQKKMRGIDYLVLTSAFGPLIEGSIGIIAIFRNSASIGKRINWMVFLASEVTSLFQLILQVPFLFYSDRVRFSEVEPRGSLLEGTFKAVVLSMAFCNITQWILNSVLLANTSIKTRLLKSCFHGQPSTWYFLDGMLGPLAIFFRFSSFLLFLRAYLGG